MSVKNTYIYDNREFHSLKELSRYIGVNEKTLTARLRRGMTLEDACQNIYFNRSYHMFENEKKSISQICKEQSKDPDLVRNRLKYGYTLNDALNKPKKISRQGSPIIVYGILYNSIAAATRELNVTYKESTIRRRLKKGMCPDEAFDFEMENTGL